MYDVGRRIAHIRQVVGISREELAIRADVAVSTIYAIEDGLQNPTTRTLRKIATGLAVPLDWLFRDNVPGKAA